MRGRYLVENPLGAVYLSLFDVAAKLFATSKARPAAISRIVLGIGGHLGDAVLATAAFPMLRRALPHAEIGVVAASWTLPVFEGHPAVSRIHCMDHWRFNRSEEHTSELQSRFGI